MSKLFKPYEGKRPYLFISYPHKQSDAVVDTIRILHEKGYRLWYDEGIPAGSDWPANIAQHMRDCQAVICFISDHFLNGKMLGVLNLIGTYTLPDFSQISISSLRLESIEDMEDLSCLAVLNKEYSYHFELLGLDDLKDLSVLRDFHGTSVYVPPQVADQAEELVAEGNFNYYEVRYPDSGWNPLDE